jgi:pimeloyl-ACP methyl ester carboxylesterase
VRKTTWLLAAFLTIFLTIALARPARAIEGCIAYYLNPIPKLCEVNRPLAGQVLDFTRNHGADRRIWSAALQTKRDVYVYVPPGYDPAKQYPGLLFLHGIGQDETAFLKLVPYFDEAIRCGRLPPVIVAAPDGSIYGKPALFNAGSFYINSKAGRFEDYIIQDVWGFVTASFPIRPERHAHILCGASMGGFGAYNLGIKYRDCFGIVAGFYAPINPRYVDCHQRYFTNFDPNCFAFRERLYPHQAVARIGPLVIRQRRFIDPIYGRGPIALAQIAAENPAEMLTTYDVKPGDLEMWVGYGALDEFNIDAQVESFLYLANCRGLTVTWVRDPTGHHNTASGVKIFPFLVEWLNPRLAPFAPK